jgi:hypothetical protein
MIICIHKTIQAAEINETVKKPVILALLVHWNPSPSYPTSHEQVNDPSVLLHVALLPQGELRHSSTSKDKCSIIANYKVRERKQLLQCVTVDSLLVLVSTTLHKG